MLFRDSSLSSTDRNGKLAAIPVVVHVVNAAAKVPIIRSMMESTIGVHKNAWLPEFTSKTFRKNVSASKTRVTTATILSRALPTKSR